MRFATLASGSSGNCSFIDTDRTHLLLDAGITKKRTVQALEELDLSLKDLDGILITHEHSDHISGLAVIARSLDIPIYATRGTIDAILSMKCGCDLDTDRFIPVKADETVRIGDIDVCPVEISHDAAEPVGYRFFSDGRKVSVCTDLGCYNEYTSDALKDSDVLLIEANHDVNMLQVGPYPYSLKQRILGRKGHLSNASSGRLLASVVNDHMKGIFLGHLSEQNNFPELAFETVRVELMDAMIPYHPDDLPIHVADRKCMSEIISF